MDALTIALIFLAVTFMWTTLHAWYIGNEKRDVALLGTSAGVFGAGAAATLLL